MSLEVLLVLALCVATLHCLEATKDTGGKKAISRISQISFNCQGEKCLITSYREEVDLKKEVDLKEEVALKEKVTDAPYKVTDAPYKVTRTDWACVTREDCKPGHCCRHYSEGSKSLYKCAPFGKEGDPCEDENHQYCECNEDTGLYCERPISPGHHIVQQSSDSLTTKVTSMSLEILIVLALCVGTLHCLEPTEVAGCRETNTCHSKICIVCYGEKCQISRQEDAGDVTTPESDSTTIKTEVAEREEASPNHWKICIDCDGDTCQFNKEYLSSEPTKLKTKDWECNDINDCKKGQCCSYYYEGSKRFQKCAAFAKPGEQCDKGNHQFCDCIVTDNLYCLTGYSTPKDDLQRCASPMRIYW